MCILLLEAEQTCLVQLESLHTSVQGQTNILQDLLLEGSDQTQTLVRKESWRIRQGQDHIQSSPNSLLCPVNYRQQMVAEASRDLEHAPSAHAANSDCFLMEQA